MNLQLRPGQVIWIDLAQIKGREQGGHRPAVVISSADHLATVAGLVIVLPATTVDRHWPNHVALTGPTQLSEPTFAMTEQPRTISRVRITGIAGSVHADCMAQLITWLQDWTVAGCAPT